MKNIFIAACMLMIGSVTAQSNFEGVIRMNTSNEAMKETATLIWYLKGESSRMEISSKAGEHSSNYVVIADSKGMDMIAEGQVTPIPTSAMKVGGATLELVSEVPNVTVNGFSCTKAVYTDGKTQTIYWLATDVEIGFNDLPYIFRASLPPIASNSFPIKMERRDATGKVILSQEVVSITRAAVSNAQFERK